MSDQMASRPGAQTPVPADDKDWTWVLERPCPQCGYDASAIDPQTLPATIGEYAGQWPGILARPGAADRPEPSVWSPTEYGAHVRDVLAMFAERVALILDVEGPTFANFDQDAAAIARQYAAADPSAVGRDIVETAEWTAREFARVEPGDWGRTGTRSDGFVFSVASLGIYCIHELRHHAWDVRG
ncbi:MAG: DinB family protein [Dermatophilaceae bacterium]